MPALQLLYEFVLDHGNVNLDGTEIIQNDDGKWYISHCGLQRGGLYLAPFFWHDDVQDLLNSK